jgi:hypothetical protein
MDAMGRTAAPEIRCYQRQSAMAAMCALGDLVTTSTAQEKCKRSFYRIRHPEGRKAEEVHQWWRGTRLVDLVRMRKAEY